MEISVVSDSERSKHQCRGSNVCTLRAVQCVRFYANRPTPTHNPNSRQRAAETSRIAYASQCVYAINWGKDHKRRLEHKRYRMINVCSTLCLAFNVNQLSDNPCVCIYVKHAYKHSITTRTGLSWTSARKSTDRQLSTRLKLAMRLPQKC